MHIVKIKNRSAFSLIEVITVLFVISLGMIGVLSLIVQNIQSQSLNKDTLIAYQLAQEGVELIRQVRDTNWHEGRAWNANLGYGDYYMDYTDSAPINAPTKSYGNLRQDANGMYLDNPLSTFTGIDFYRIISIKDQSPGMLVISTIYWSDHGRNYNYSLEAVLYDWR
ncbi:MAG: prepilin-type N-terminal cleavage/methylation domain-containing protein [Candidatus Falkowbacteria bacterium]